jgi:hypothetical protein
LKNPGKALRDAYMAALTGITYGGNTITVYDDLPIGTLPQNYVYINSIDVGRNWDNNSHFNITGVITIDIVTKQYKKVDRDTVDGIAEVVMNTILPTIRGGVLSDTNFSFYNVNLESSRYLVGQDGDAQLTRKILRFSQTLIQK